MKVQMWMSGYMVIDMFKEFFMVKMKDYLLCVVSTLLLASSGICQGADEGAAATPTIAPVVPAIATSEEVGSRVVEDGGTGLYKATMVSDGSLATHTVFRPTDLNPFGETIKLPIVVWGNGACANSPWEHINFLSEVASHGFLVIAIGPMPVEGQSGGGSSKSAQMTDAINWAIAQNADKNSQYYGKLDTGKIAVAGMSCGGLQCLEIAPDPRVSTVLVCNSGIFGNSSGIAVIPSLTKEYLTKIHTPIIYILGGTTDIAYNNGMDDFKRIDHVPAVAANLEGVGHGGTYGQPHGGDFSKVATAWLQWQLKGDTEAAKMFEGDDCGVSKMTGWKIEKKNMK